MLIVLFCMKKNDTVLLHTYIIFVYFQENMKRILNAKKYEKIEVFLKSYWNLKEPLLRKSFKIAQTDKGFDSRLNLL